jgi:NAD(P)H dehydrogenase (quinone)
MKIGIIFYSTYGHTYHLAKAIREGALQVDGSEVDLLQIQETLSSEILKKMGAYEAKKSFQEIPIAKAQDLQNYDALIFGTPTRFGNMSAQMRAFFDATGSLWAKGSLIGKIGSVFVSTGSQHGGHETTIQSVHTTLLHHGMIIAGVPYSCKELTNMNEITGGSPYGAGTIAGSDGSRLPTKNELEIARQQGIFVAKITKKLTTNL